jgi:DNA-binding response OmpR family regulator
MAEVMAPTPNTSQVHRNVFPMQSGGNDPDQPYILLIDGPGSGPRITANQLTRLGCAVCHVAAEQAIEFSNQRYHAVVINGDLSDLHSSTFVREVRNLDKRHGSRTPILALPAAESYSRRRYLADSDVDEILGQSIAPDELRETLMLWLPPSGEGSLPSRAA